MSGYSSHADFTGKVTWEGTVLSIQPRTRVWRYLIDNRTHHHLGYTFFLENTKNGTSIKFSVAVSEKQQQAGGYAIDDVLQGTAWTKAYPEREFADYYRAGAIKILGRNHERNELKPPPWIMPPLPMKTYEARGARQLHKNLWKTTCFQCVYAAMANVEIQWNFDKGTKKYRFETFCYGPKSCAYYKMGRPRSVSYKNRGPALDDGCLDDLCTAGRDQDE
jgi:hypothetical protein